MSQKKQFLASDETQPEDFRPFSLDPSPSPEEQKAIYHYSKWAARKHASNPYVLLALFVFFVFVTMYLFSSTNDTLRSLGLLTSWLGLACLVEALRKDARREAYIAGYKRGTFEVLKKK